MSSGSRTGAAAASLMSAGSMSPTSGVSDSAWIHALSWAIDVSLTRRTGPASARLMTSPGRPPWAPEIGREAGSSCQTSRNRAPMRSLSQTLTSSSAGARNRCRERPTGTGPRPSGVSTRIVAPSARSVSRMVSSSTASAVTRSSWCTSRAVTTSPASSTRAQRRSPANPDGSTTADSTSTPPRDLTG